MTNIRKIADLILHHASLMTNLENGQLKCGRPFGYFGKNMSNKTEEYIKIEEYGHIEKQKTYSSWKTDFYRLTRKSKFSECSSPYTSKKELINEVKKLINYETKFDKLRKKLRLFFMNISNKF
jgi:hypothetical protein